MTTEKRQINVQEIRKMIVEDHKTWEEVRNHFGLNKNQMSNIRRNHQALKNLRQRQQQDFVVVDIPLTENVETQNETIAHQPIVTNIH